MLTLFIAGVTALVNGAVMLAVLRHELRELRRDVARANKRLDLIGAPNVTLDPD